MSENITNNAGTEAISPPIPSLEVRVYPQAKRNENDKLLGFASVTLGGVFAVNGIRLMDSEKGPFVAMPSKPDGSKTFWRGASAWRTAAAAACR